jgi:hypothetical protein
VSRRIYEYQLTADDPRCLRREPITALRGRRLNAEVNLHRLEQALRKRLKFGPKKAAGQKRKRADRGTILAKVHFSGRFLSYGHRSARLAAAAYISFEEFL